MRLPSDAPEMPRMPAPPPSTPVLQATLRLPVSIFVMPSSTLTTKTKGRDAAADVATTRAKTTADPSILMRAPFLGLLVQMLGNGWRGVLRGRCTTMDRTGLTHRASRFVGRAPGQTCPRDRRRLRPAIPWQLGLPLAMPSERVGHSRSGRLSPAPWDANSEKNPTLIPYCDAIFEARWPAEDVNQYPADMITIRPVPYGWL